MVNTENGSTFTPDVLSFNDYYPFGMLLPNRSGSSDSYRYGFQEQEKDDEIKGEGNSLNYTFRMHDPRVGRFFAVDPLTKKYPHYSPYSFSGNKVIAHIELEGMEDLSINVLNPATPNGTGVAKLTISMEHQIVTQGTGELHNRADINSADYAAIYDTGDITLYSTNLPSQDQPANFLTGYQERWAKKATNHRKPKKRAEFRQKLTESGVNSFYQINVDYNYSITNTPNRTITDAVNWVSSNVAGRGIIFNPEINLSNSIGKNNFNSNSDIYTGIMIVNSLGLSLRSDHAAVGLSEGLMGGKDPSTNYNFVAGNPIHFGKGTTYSFTLSATKTMVPEVGHNNAANSIHNSKIYEYDQAGTQSSTNPRPSKQNTINIINDQTNRNSL